MPISRALRYQILRRDNHTCRYCGATALDARLTVDHVMPTALGGSDDPSNLVTACVDCNAGKAATPADAPIIADVAQDARRWAAAMRAVATIDHDNWDKRLERRQAFNELWSGWNYGPDNRPIPRPDNWPDSIDQLAAAGAQLADLAEAIDIAMHKAKVRPEDTWRYMCGILWRRLEKRTQAAQELLATEEE